MDIEAMAQELLDIRTRLNREQFHRRMDDFGKGELFVLGHLYRSAGPVYPKDLSKVMTVSSARVAVLLNHMEEKGWLVRTTDPADPRQTLVTLTAAGTEHFETEEHAIIGIVRDVLEKLGEQDARELLRIQKRLLTDAG